MILQALYDYYHRKASLGGETGIASLGMEKKEIPFVIVIDPEGNFIRLEERSEGSGKKKRPAQFFVQQVKPRSSTGGWKIAFDFWDHWGYVLGVPEENTIKAQKIAMKRNNTFKEVVAKHCTAHPENDDFRAVNAFYSNENNKELIKNDPLWETLIKKRVNLSFRLVSEDTLVAEHSDLCVQTIGTIVDEANAKICLVTGQKHPIKRTHAAIQIVGGTPNARLICFNNPSENSYKKEQGMNAPISELAEFAYTTALKELLSKESSNKFRLGDTTFVFWSEEDKSFEDVFVFSCLLKNEDNPDQSIEAVMEYLKAPFKGKLSEIEKSRFFLLGLEQPSQGRLSVRHWRVGTIKYFAESLRKHFEDFKVEEAIDYSLYNILEQLYIPLKDRKEKYPPYISNIIGDMMKSIFDGILYPTSLQLRCINKLRKELHQLGNKAITPIGVAILKAYINRKNRLLYKSNKIIGMALDYQEKNPGYLFGRLFAIFEKIQEEANYDCRINTTITDRFFAIALVSPLKVFKELSKLKNQHIKKIKQRNIGRAINLERMIDDVMSNFDAKGIPINLSIDNQSYFIVGYHHQRKELYSKKQIN